jgi:transcriptional regulator with XRE-family HTH domain
VDWDEVLAHVGERIRAEREARGWSRQQLAHRAEIREATVRRLEAGNVWLRPLMKACWAFRVPVNHLLSDQWSRPARRPTLSLRQVDVLREAASGDSLELLGPRLGLQPESVGAALSRIYVRLGVSDVPRDQRRSAAVEVAVRYGLMTP